MPAKRKNSKKQSKLKRITKALIPNTKLKQLVAFVLIFGAVGGGIFLYRSFATSPWEYLLTANACYGFGGIPATISDSKPNNTGCVKVAQYFLMHKAGQFVSQNGYFDSGTKNATIEWQKANNIAVDGIIGTQTWYTFAAEMNATFTNDTYSNYAYLGQGNNKTKVWACHNTIQGIYENVRFLFQKPKGAIMGPRYQAEIQRVSLGAHVVGPSISGNGYLYGTIGSLTLTGLDIRTDYGDLAVIHTDVFDGSSWGLGPSNIRSWPACR